LLSSSGSHGLGFVPTEHRPIAREEEEEKEGAVQKSCESKAAPRASGGHIDDPTKINNQQASEVNTRLFLVGSIPQREHGG
jgi:hypothetical protein